MALTPKPEVVYLPAVFREISRGATRIPAFQRGFIWTQGQVLELLESVYKEYPIGSLLFWHVGVDEMRTDNSPDVPFPHPKVEGTVDFVLDGMQRISSLFGAFHAREIVSEGDPFDIVFDLKDREFRHFSETTDTSIRLRVLLIPKELLSEQARLAKLDDGEELIERSLYLQSVFQEYLVPIVRIGERSVSEVVEIFERVNSTGTRLGAVDFMRALTWSADFDLSEELEELAGVAQEAGYVMPTDTLAKLMALVLGVVPTGSEMLKLRDEDADKLRKAAKDTRSALAVALKFLRSELKLLSYDYVPYEGQFLVIASLAAATEGKFPDWVQKWFWTVSFSEAMQGRPDHAIARQALGVRDEPDTPIAEHFSLTAKDLRSRAVRKGASLSMAMVAAIATTPARSIFTGELIPEEEIIAKFEPMCLAAIFSKSELDDVVEPSPRGNRVIANIVLLRINERRPSPSAPNVRAAILELAKSQEGRRALDSQCITSDCVRAIEAKDVDQFLTARANAMMVIARKLSDA